MFWEGRGRRTHGGDKANLDLFWIRDDALEDTENLPDPDVIAREIVEDLRTALEEFEEIAAELEG